MSRTAGPKYSETFVVDVDRWNPWRALSERDDLIFGLCRLPAGIRGLYLPDSPKSFVLVDEGLDMSWRNAVLAHELVHHERGGGCVLEGMPAAWAAMAAREELRVWREVARRLCPLAEMRAVAELARVNELPFATWEVAEQFDVPHMVALLAAERTDLQLTA